MKPLAIDLYCGLGGWAEGFLAEGYACYDWTCHIQRVCLKIGFGKRSIRREIVGYGQHRGRGLDTGSSCAEKGFLQRWRIGLYTNSLSAPFPLESRCFIGATIPVASVPTICSSGLNKTICETCEPKGAGDIVQGIKAASETQTQSFLTHKSLQCWRKLNLAEVQ